MKKFGLFLVGFLFIFVLAACGKGESLDKSQVLGKLIEANKSLQSYSVEMNMDIDMEEIEQTLTMSGDITHNPDTMYLDMSMGMPGMTMEMETYVNEDESYMSMFGDWMKMDTEELGISSFDQLNQEELEKLSQFTEQFEMTEEEDQYILTLSGNDDTYKVLIEELVLSSMGDLSSDPYMEELLNSIKINQIELEYHIDKETFFQTAQIFNIALELDEEGTITPMKLNGEITISNMNEVEPIEIPKDVKENAVTEEEMYALPESMSIEEIQELVAFKVLEPTHLPEGYFYTEGYYDESMEMVMLSYDKDEDNWIMVTIYPTDVMSLADMEGEGITVRNTEGIFYEMDGYLSISWELDGLLVELSGVGTDLTKDQMLKIAESMQ